MCKIKIGMHYESVKATRIKCHNYVFEITVPPSPEMFSVNTILGSPNHLLASWKQTNGNFDAYTVYCNVSASQAYPEQEIGQNLPTVRSVVNATTFTTTITGLKPYTQYDCYVTPTALLQEEAPSQIVTNRTDEYCK